ncbi:MAG: cytochrome c family protein [Desulfobulbaceae bacterium]|nr:cytochrome c family protein [Desulfobulbaceae bacterium]
MKKMIICTAAFAFAFTCAVAGVSVAANHGPAEMTLSDTGKKPAHFPHKAHQDRGKCADCHHTDGTPGSYVAGKEAKCSTCHNKDMANKKLASFKNAAHAKCKGCHKEHKAPTKCGTCHPKK